MQRIKIYFKPWTGM